MWEGSVPEWPFFSGSLCGTVCGAVGTGQRRRGQGLRGRGGGPLGLATGAPRDEGSLRKLRVLPSSSSRRDGKIDRRTQMRRVVREMEKECPL